MTIRSDLLDAQPDLVLLLKRDGSLLGFTGGSSIPALQPQGSVEGQDLETVWPADAAKLVKQLIRRAILNREMTEADFMDGATRYEARVTPQGPERAMCVVRASIPTLGDERGASPEARTGHADRRGFLRRLKESMSVAALKEDPLAVAMIRVDGVLDISQVLDSKVADQVIGIAIGRITSRSTEAAAEPPWYMGQFAENLLVLVLNSSSRDLIDACVTRVCASLREPIQIGDAVFQLTPYAGVAVLGQDAASPKTLLDHARSSAIEARRAGSARVHFFSDTLQLRSLARLDIARELREAIANRDLRLRYVGRHDLATGKLVALVGYLQWTHPLRGEVRPAEFLGVAETTGLSAALSRSVLGCLRDDIANFESRYEPHVRISFGALRHHVLSENFLTEMQDFLSQNSIRAERLELRIAERSYVTQDARVWKALAGLGVQLTVDEVGRKMSSLDLLAHAPLSGLQLDRSWVTALAHDPAAIKVCRALVGLAAAFGLIPIATGVDDAQQRDALLRLGFREGLGDFYGAAEGYRAAGLPASRERKRK